MIIENLSECKTLDEMFIASLKVYHTEIFEGLDISRVKEIINKVFGEENGGDATIIALGNAFYEAEEYIRKTGISLDDFMAVCKKKALN